MKVYIVERYNSNGYNSICEAFISIEQAKKYIIEQCDISIEKAHFFHSGDDLKKEIQKLNDTKELYLKAKFNDMKPYTSYNTARYIIHCLPLILKDGVGY